MESDDQEQLERCKSTAVMQNIKDLRDYIICDGKDADYLRTVTLVHRYHVHRTALLSNQSI